LKKETFKKGAYYKIAWSPEYKYDRFRAHKVLPELSGIICLYYKAQSRIRYLLFHPCWRDGCRVGLKKLLDPAMTRQPEILRQLDLEELFFKYTLVETNISDLQDIIYWLIRTYRPTFNDFENFKDSQRYRDINVKETSRDESQVIEKL
jgi:hypothetical protein